MAMVFRRTIQAISPALSPFRAHFITHTSRTCLIWVVSFGTAIWLLGPYRLHLGATNAPSFCCPTLVPPPSIWDLRAQQVKDAFFYAYSNYQARAAPHDELLPVSGGHIDNFNGWRVTLVDALDTLWIMGFRDEFMAALPEISRETFNLNKESYAPFFETVIRYLGGLLSAYTLSGEQILLSLADDLGQKLLPVFSTPSGLPKYGINTMTGATTPGRNIAWVETTSCQLEFKYLAHLSGRTEYYEAVEKVMTLMYNSTFPHGLFPTFWDTISGSPVNAQFSAGAYADSGYEYLLKQWLHSGQSETKARDQYLQSITGILDNLFYLSPTRRLLYVTDIHGGKPSHVMEHLSCFLPGLLALGAHTLNPPIPEKERHIWAAEGLAHTCWLMYKDMTSGLAADEINMSPWPDSGPTSTEGYGTGRWREHLLVWESEGRPGGVPPGLTFVVTGEDESERDYSLRKDEYLLRPETVESFFFLWKFTGQEVWRHRGWAVFEAIEKNTRTQYGYASIQNVDTSPAPKKNSMPSYFLAETLKYLYLLFVDDDIIPLNKWVFNTEAHPLPIYNWTDSEKSLYRIPS